MEGKWGKQDVGSIVCMIMMPIYMMNSIQSSFTPAERNAVLAVGAFLTPADEIFSFLEDLMVVRISYAIATKRYYLANRLLRFGLLVGFCCGVVGAAVCSLLTVSEKVYEAIVLPGYDRDVEQYPDCELVSVGHSLLRSTKPYFLLLVWKWPLGFMNTCLGGFALGWAKGDQRARVMVWE